MKYFNSKLKYIIFHTLTTAGVFAGSLVFLFAAARFVSAFTSPACNPPGCNVPAPLRPSPHGSIDVGDDANLININALVGYDDLFLKGKADETAPIYYGASEHRFYTQGAERLTISDGGMSTAFGGFGTYENLLRDSESFETATWIKSYTPVITPDNATAPDGTQNADKIEDDDTIHDEGIVQIYVPTQPIVLGESFTLSVWLEAGTATEATIVVETRPGSKFGGLLDFEFKKVPLTDGWQRAAITVVPTKTNLKKIIVQIKLDQSQTGTFYAWGAQLEKAPSATLYAHTTDQVIQRGNSLLGDTLRVGKQGIIFSDETIQKTAMREWQINATDIYNTNSGNVGIGSPQIPQARVEIAGALDKNALRVVANRSSQDIAFDWAKDVPAVTRLYDSATDSQGNFYVGGNNNKNYGVIRKYNAAGILLWSVNQTMTFGAMALDHLDNIIVAGPYGGVGLVEKYDPSGTLLWSTQVSARQPRAVALDSQDNVYVAGGFGFDDQPNEPTWYTAKLTSSGSVLWSDIYDPTPECPSIIVGNKKVCIGQPPGDQLDAVAIDSQDNAIVSGWLKNKSLGGMRKYDQSGRVLWTTTNIPRAVTRNKVDGAGNVYLLTQVLSSSPTPPPTIEKYDVNGSFIGTFKDLAIDGFSNDNLTMDFDLDQSGNIYVAGMSGSGANTKWQIAGYNPSGTLLGNFPIIEDISGGIDAPSSISITNKMLVAGSANNNSYGHMRVYSLMKITSSTFSINSSGDTGISQSSPLSKLTVNNPETAGKTGSAGDAIYAYANSANAAISAEQTDPAGYAGYFNGKLAVNGGSVGIGTIDPGADKLDVRGRAYAEGGWQTTNADYAEWFEKEEATKAGDIIGIDLLTGKVRKYKAGDRFLGVYSSHPSVVGNRLKETDEEMEKDHTLVSLLGQIEFDRSQVEIIGNIVKTKDGKEIGVLLSNGKVLIGK